jgi:hypothetical protein
MPALKLFWYDGLDKTPEVPGVPAGELLGDLPFSRPPQQAQGQPRVAPPRTGYVGRMFDMERYERMMADPNRMVPRPDGSVFIGDKGMITTGTYGEETRLLPVEKMRDYKGAPTLLTRSPGHYRDWIRACKGGEAACSNFNVAAPFTEWMLLGVIALRVEGKIEYDPVKMRITNNAAANKYLKPTIRKGWQFS